MPSTSGEIPTIPACKILVFMAEDEFQVSLFDYFTLHHYQVTHAKNLFEAGELLRAISPDVLLLDYETFLAYGPRIFTTVLAGSPGMEVIVIGAAPSETALCDLLRHGRAFDIIDRDIKLLRDLERVVVLAFQKRRRLLIELTHALSDRPSAHPQSAPAQSPALTPRETDTLALLALGLENKAIALELVLSENTIRNNLARIYGKLGAANRTQAVQYARERGLVK